MLTISKGWLRSAVFLGVNCAGALLLYVVAAAPAADLLQDQRRRIEQGTLTRERTRSALARNEAVAAISPDQIDAAAQRFLRGGSEGLQNADLLGRLHQAAAEHGVSLGSATPLPPREWFDRRMVGARIEFVAPTEHAARFLAGLEGGAALLFIDRATLSSNRDEDADMLAVMIEVYGVARWPEG